MTALGQYPCQEIEGVWGSTAVSSYVENDNSLNDEKQCLFISKNGTEQLISCFVTNGTSTCRNINCMVPCGKSVS